jgi:hypothetical protein
MAAEKLTTKQAMERAGNISRHALMRAKKKGQLFAEADNQGNLLWDAAALDRWAKERPEPSTPPKARTTTAEGPAPELWTMLADARERAARAEGERDGLREALTAERARTTATEANAERWREMAEKRRRWWPFG